MFKSWRMTVSFILTLCMALSLPLQFAFAEGGEPPSDGGNPLELIVSPINHVSIFENTISADRKTITTKFSVPVTFNTSLADLKTKVQLRVDDSSPVDLLAGDTVTLAGQLLTIKLATALGTSATGVNVSIKANALKTTYNITQEEEIFNGMAIAVIDKTPPIIQEIPVTPGSDDLAPDITVSPDNKTITVGFNEPIFNASSASTAALKAEALKAAIVIAQGEEPLSPPQSVSSVTITGNKMTIKMANSFNNSYYTTIGIAPNSIQDALGNKNHYSIPIPFDAKLDMVPPQIQTIELLGDMRTIVATLSEPAVLFSTAADLRASVNLFNPYYPRYKLKTGDTVDLKGNKLTIKLKKALPQHHSYFSYGMSLESYTGVLKDLAGNTALGAGGGMNNQPPDILGDGMWGEGVLISPDNKTMTLLFNEPIFFDDPATAKLDVKVLDESAPQPKLLGATDKVAISGNKLIVTFASKITSDTSILIAPNVLVDAHGAFLSESVETEPVYPDSDKPFIEGVEVLPNNKVVNLYFGEHSVASASTASSAAAKIAALKAQIRKVNGETVSELVAGDTIRFSDPVTLQITLATPLTAPTAFRLLAGAVVDAAGNINDESTSEPALIDTTKPFVEDRLFEDFGKRVVFIFNEPISLGAGVTATTLATKVKMNGAVLPTGSKAVILEGDKLVLTFTAPLTVGTKLFSIDDNAVRDAAGNGYVTPAPMPD
jgi:hypothetical protein